MPGPGKTVGKAYLPEGVWPFLASFFAEPQQAAFSAQQLFSAGAEQQADFSADLAWSSAKAAELANRETKARARRVRMDFMVGSVWMGFGF